MILDDIVNKKRMTLNENRYCFNILNLCEKIKKDKISSFYDAMAKEGLSIIGEIKKASPSKGLIKENFNPVEIAKQYENTVDAISVLTEEHFFKGSNEYLIDVHNTVNLPILRKDFIISPMQIFEAREIGASAVLLIVSVIKSKELLKEFIDFAYGLNLDVLIEVHDEKEIDIAVNSGAKIIGINNRNLNDFSENINTTLKLSEFIPKDIIKISESSIHCREDIFIIKKAGVNGILVGESFMKACNIAEKAEEFRNAYKCSN